MRLFVLGLAITLGITELLAGCAAEQPIERAEQETGVEEATAELTTMSASYYSDALEGQPTADGETYRGSGYTAAHRTLPLGTVLKVCYHDCTRVLVNDRNPYSTEDLDLSRAAATDIGLTTDGHGAVDTEVVERP